MVHITLILCTFNRCQSLRKTLESLAISTLPESVGWEVLVVDNNSCDHTRVVVEDFTRHYPGRFRYLFEPRPGKSNALNTGIREASGDILVFTDDDVIVDPTWLQNLTANLHDGEWAGIGGRTVPDREFSFPRWALREKYSLGLLGIFDRGPDAFELKEPPFGNNMAYQRKMFEKYGGFREDLGPQPDNHFQNEDTEFGLRLLAAGERLRYEPSAVIQHSVPEARFQVDYFLRWWFNKGRAEVRAFGFEAGTKLYIAGVPLVLFRRIAVWTLRWIFTFESPGRFSNKVKVWNAAGAIVECHNQELSKMRQSRQKSSDNPAISSPEGSGMAQAADNRTVSVKK